MIAFGIFWVVAAGVALAVFRWLKTSRRLNPEWLAFTLTGAGLPTNVLCYRDRKSVSDDQAERLLACLRSCAELLSERFGAVRAAAALGNVRVAQSATGEWEDGYGRKVGAQAWPGTKVVLTGPGFAGLMHELLHFALDAAERDPGYDHAGWAEKGYNALVERYERERI